MLLLNNNLNLFYKYLRDSNGRRRKQSCRYSWWYSDPNSPVKKQNQGVSNNQQESEQMLQLIKEAFRNCSQNGQLTMDKFNQALSILEALGFKRLRDTPLADRLFHIFDHVLILLSRVAQVQSAKVSSFKESQVLLEIVRTPSNVVLIVGRHL